MDRLDRIRWKWRPKVNEGPDLVDDETFLLSVIDKLTAERDALKARVREMEAALRSTMTCDNCGNHIHRYDTIDGTVYDDGCVCLVNNPNHTHNRAADWECESWWEKPNA